MTCRTWSAGCPAPYRRRCTDRDTKIADFYLYLAAALVTVRLLAEIRLLDHRRFSTDKVEKVAQQNRVRGDRSTVRWGSDRNSTGPSSIDAPMPP
ncbi:hypothetical protein F8279_12360 [Micromonospora sp. AMSO1212t]|nr:hypothetical protein F8279_12360 [Micromonospora sp. AMSO1212t]